jgi:hypothetical protein
LLSPCRFEGHPEIAAVADGHSVVRSRRAGLSCMRSKRRCGAFTGLLIFARPSCWPPILATMRTAWLRAPANWRAQSGARPVFLRIVCQAGLVGSRRRHESLCVWEPQFNPIGSWLFAWALCAGQRWARWQILTKPSIRYRSGMGARGLCSPSARPDAAAHAGAAER